MAFTAKDVQTLRERTGCGMMDCKKALQSSDGDMDKAVEFLREKGLAAVEKKAGRIAAEGMVYADYFAEYQAGVLIEVNSETDFVAKNESFQGFVKACAKAVAAGNPKDLDALMALKAEGGETVEEMLREKVLTIGENIKIRRFVRFAGDVATYIHGEGRIGVMVQFDTDVAGKPGFEEFGKDVAMQIAAINPPYLDKASVPEAALAEEKKILTQQAINEGKPEKIAEKVVLGRLGKFYKESCLVEQEFVKDPDISVGKYTEQTAKTLGGHITIVGFARYERGEGLQKREDNFAEEIANMVK